MSCRRKRAAGNCCLTALPRSLLPPAGRFQHPPCCGLRRWYLVKKTPKNPHIYIFISLDIFIFWLLKMNSNWQNWMLNFLIITMLHLSQSTVILLKKQQIKQKLMAWWQSFIFSKFISVQVAFKTLCTDSPDVTFEVKSERDVNIFTQNPAWSKSAPYDVEVKLPDSSDWVGANDHITIITIITLYTRVKPDKVTVALLPAGAEKSSDLTTNLRTTWSC